MRIIDKVQFFFFLISVILAVKREGFLGYRTSYIVPSGCWCDIIVLNVHAIPRIKVGMKRTISMRNWTRYLRL